MPSVKLGMTVRLNTLAWGLALGTVLGAGMLLFSIVALGGRIPDAEQWMETFHVFYKLTFIGIIAGILEAALFGVGFGSGAAWTYNRVVNRLER